MNWSFLDHNFWTTIVAFFAFVAASIVGYFQYKINKSIHRIQDSVEVYAFYSTMTIKIDGEKENIKPQIHVLNVGTRVIYLEKYVFNGRTYFTNNQVLPPTYSNTQAIYYIDLPVNGEKYVSVELYYKDEEGRCWNSEIVAELDLYWKVKNLPGVKLSK